MQSRIQHETTNNNSPIEQALSFNHNEPNGDDINKVIDEALSMAGLRDSFTGRPIKVDEA